MASQKDISKICGVSVATVSKALSGQRDIGEETKAYIIKVAEEIGYLPNLSARALRTNRTYNIGVLLVDEAHDYLKHDYFANMLNSFKRVAEAKGYNLTFVNTDKSRQGGKSYLEDCRYRGFDGVLIACADFVSDDVIELLKSDIPLVTIDYVFDGRISVVSDNIQGMHDLLTYVYGKGHRRIAYITGKKSNVTVSRLASFYNTAEELGLDIPAEYVKTAAYRDTDAAYRMTKELLALPTAPTCILYPDDYAALGGVNAIRELGLRIPEDISIAGYDGIDVIKILEPQMTTLAQDAEQVGGRAAEALMGLIERPRSTLIELIVVPGHVIPGKSVATLA